MQPVLQKRVNLGEIAISHHEIFESMQLQQKMHGLFRKRFLISCVQRQIEISLMQTS